MGDLYVEGR